MGLRRQQSMTIRCGRLAHAALLVSTILIHDAVYAQCSCGDEERPEAAVLNSGARQIGSYNRVQSATFSPDGNLIVAAGYGPSQICDVHNGRPIRQIGLAHGAIDCVAFGPDGKTIVIASSHPEISFLRGEKSFVIHSVQNHSRLTLWDVETGAMIREFEGEKGLISIHVADPEDQSRIKEVLTFDGQREVITSIAYSSDGTTLLSGGQWKLAPFSPGFGALKIWDVNTGKMKVTLDRVPGYFERASFSHDGRTVLSAASLSSTESAVNQAQIEIVTSNIEDGDTELRRRWTLHRHGFTGTRQFFSRNEFIGTRQFFSPNAQFVAAINGKEIHLFAVNTVQEPRVLSGCRESLSRVAFLSDGNRIAANCYHGPIYVWDLLGENGLPLEISTEGDPAHGVVFSPDGKIIVSWGGQCLRFWNSATGEPILDERGHQLVINPESKRCGGQSRQ